MNISELLQNKKALAMICGVLVVIIIIAAVIWPKPAAPAPTVNNAQVTLTWWKPAFSNNNDDIYSDIITDFRKIPGNQNVTIKIVNRDYGTDYYNTLIADIAKYAGPDIFTIRNDDLPAYKEYMSPIRLFTGKELLNYRNSFTDLVVRDTMYTDKVYAISSYVDNMQLYYNQTLLSQNKISLPPKTWDELNRQLPLLNKRDTNSLNFTQSAISLGTGNRGLDGSANINRFADIIPLLIFQNGGQMYDYQQSRSIFGDSKNSQAVASGLATSNQFEPKEVKQDSPAYKGIRFYTDFSTITSQRYSWNTASRNNIDDFTDGRLAYMLHYSYMSDIIKQRNPLLKFNVAEMPQLDTNLKKTYGFFFMDGINRSLEKDPSKQLQRQAAESFLKYLSTKPAQTKYAAKTRLPGARKDVIADQINADQDLQIFAAGSLYADNYYKPDVVGTELIWGRMMERNQYEGQALEESITQAIREYNIIIQKGPKLRTQST